MKAPKLGTITLVAVALAIVSGLVVSYCRDQPAPPAKPAQATAQLALGRAVAAWAIEAAGYRRTVDSLDRVATRLRADSTRLARRRTTAEASAVAARDTLARVLAGLHDTATADTIRRQVATIDSAGAACTVLLTNCEARARVVGMRAAVAEAQLARVNRRTGIVLAAALAVVAAVIVSR